jgi:hypothetical protein
MIMSMGENRDEIEYLALLGVSRIPKKVGKSIHFQSGIIR